MRVASAIIVAGCSLAGLVSCLNPAEADPTRSFQPARSSQELDLDPQLVAGQSLRLLSVTGASHLKERMAYRVDDTEFGFHEHLRWSELPEVYVERSLTRVLFESGAFVRSEQHTAPRLHVALRGFEELRTGNASLAWVQVAVRVELEDEGTVLEREFEAQSEAAAEGPRALAEAMGRALRELSSQIAAEVAQGVSAHR